MKSLKHLGKWLNQFSRGAKKDQPLEQHLIDSLKTGSVFPKQIKQYSSYVKGLGELIDKGHSSPPVIKEVDAVADKIMAMNKKIVAQKPKDVSLHDANKLFLRLMDVKLKTLS